MHNWVVVVVVACFCLSLFAAVISFSLGALAISTLLFLLLVRRGNCRTSAAAFYSSSSVLFVPEIANTQRETEGSHFTVWRRARKRVCCVCCDWRAEFQFANFFAALRLLATVSLSLSLCVCLPACLHLQATLLLHCSAAAFTLLAIQSLIGGDRLLLLLPYPLVSSSSSLGGFVCQCVCVLIDRQCHTVSLCVAHDRQQFGCLLKKECPR